MPESQQIEARGGVSYATHDGVALAGDLYLPAGAGPFPALVGTMVERALKNAAAT